MSDDLIRRNSLLEDFRNTITEQSDTMDWLNMIARQPVAYDVDKVVEQLDKCKQIMESPVRQDCYNEECRVGDCTVCAFEKAIEIVKAGGVNG